MILDTNLKVVRAYLAGAVAANEPEWNASWADHNPIARTFTPGHTNGVLNGATAVETVGNPATGTQRQIKLLSFFNADTVAVTVTVDVYDGTNSRRWVQAVLNPSWSLAWEPGNRWHVYDENGISQGPGDIGEITVEEVDLSPSYTEVTKLQFDQADGFVVSQPSAGIARIDASGTPDQEARFLAFWKFFNRGM